MILVTGPTGSGKSTTLYATLNIVSKPEINVITVEDPVEYRLPGSTRCRPTRRPA
jgi:type IV pilus assembly protein PilB